MSDIDLCSGNGDYLFGEALEHLSHPSLADHRSPDLNHVVLIPAALLILFPSCGVLRSPPVCPLGRCPKHSTRAQERRRPAVIAMTLNRFSHITVDSQ
jgi:hypothetical protein